MSVNDLETSVLRTLCRLKGWHIAAHRRGTIIDKVVKPAYFLRLIDNDKVIVDQYSETERDAYITALKNET